MYSAICIIIMTVVTYIPRAIPVTFFNKKIENKFIKSFLFYVPYAVLAALTFPSVLYFMDNMVIALIGTIVAIVLSLFRQKLFVVAMASILVVFVLQYIL